ncbi:MAG: imidazole glycerol phosphate synthase subunit HisH [Candidatus Nitrohelix vancouverensis]|uniref:Imidazole glycerol phosphate synthase subunit HisH n=1 Tax=Candidatus Nitrohelix vancouverensis TaxID=2705534 RepID=A0A7T0C572_9BACT|nr:MAG: imidazole glycerol phosphate synthase subunit HisH [Candidatus Nitrohelix vancouverensis]
MVNVAIVDYGLGNLFSIQRAFDSLGANSCITEKPEELTAADKIVLPGVGAFEEGMCRLRKNGLMEALIAVKVMGKPILGICLGMQLLMSESEENGLHSGLDFLTGRVVRFTPCINPDERYKIPHICWNSIQRPDEAEDTWSRSVLSGIPGGAFMYFAHSYYVEITGNNDLLAKTSYGVDHFASVVQKDNVAGCQFHPERSGEQGLQILNNFVNG